MDSGRLQQDCAPAVAAIPATATARTTVLESKCAIWSGLLILSQRLLPGVTVWALVASTEGVGSEVQLVVADEAKVGWSSGCVGWRVVCGVCGIQLLHFLSEQSANQSGKPCLPAKFLAYSECDATLAPISTVVAIVYTDLISGRCFKTNSTMIRIWKSLVFSI
jgi:hypothetical protein